MSAQPFTAPNPLVPATVPSGFGSGNKTNKILVNLISGVYHCATCDYIGESYFVVRRHRADAHGKGAGRRKGSKGKPSIEDRLTQAVTLLMEVRDALADQAAAPAKTDTVPAEWKTRALAAEKSLKSLRRILGTDSEVAR